MFSSPQVEQYPSSTNQLYACTQIIEREIERLPGPGREKQSGSGAVVTRAARLSHGVACF